MQGIIQGPQDLKRGLEDRQSTNGSCRHNRMNQDIPAVEAGVRLEAAAGSCCFDEDLEEGMVHPPEAAVGAMVHSSWEGGEVGWEYRSDQVAALGME